ncbi:MAG: sigma factor [Phycisphaerae bacterium]|nr:sigma factor [Phycisphaerae bacterium]
MSATNQTNSSASSIDEAGGLSSLVALQPRDLDQLGARWGAMSRDEFAVAVRRLEPVVRVAVARRFNALHPSEVDEVVWSSFARAWLKRDRYQPDRADVVSWLLGIAGNTAKTLLRERVMGLVRLDLSLDSGHSLEQTPLTDDERERVCTFLRSLPSRAQDVLAFHALRADDADWASQYARLAGRTSRYWRVFLHRLHRRIADEVRSDIPQGAMRLTESARSSAEVGMTRINRRLARIPAASPLPRNVDRAVNLIRQLEWDEQSFRNECDASAERFVATAKGLALPAVSAAIAGCLRMAAIRLRKEVQDRQSASQGLWWACVDWRRPTAGGVISVLPRGPRSRPEQLAWPVGHEIEAAIPAELGTDRIDVRTYLADHLLSELQQGLLDLAGTVRMTNHGETFMVLAVLPIEIEQKETMLQLEEMLAAPVSAAVAARLASSACA